jgi:biotin carboxyl carrier protein
MQRYQLEVNGNLYTVTVKSIFGDRAMVDVDGMEFEVRIADGDPRMTFAPITTAAPAAPTVHKEPGKKRSSMLDRMTPKKVAGPIATDKGVIAAHLPGLILEILVKPGDKVIVGDVVIKMEAMKMVNEVRSQIEGTVKDVLVTLQQNVLENQALLVIE